MNQAFPKVFADFGLLIETLEFREIRGYVYTRPKPFGVGDRNGGKLPPKLLLWLVLRLHPAFRRRLATCKAALRGRLDRTLTERWYNEWRPRLISDISRLRAVDLSALTDEDLAANLMELRRWLFDAFDTHFYLSGANGFPLGRLLFFCRDQLRYDDMQTIALMSGLSGASSAPAIALAALADRLRGDDVLQPALLDAKPADVATSHRPDTRSARFSTAAARVPATKPNCTAEVSQATSEPPRCQRPASSRAAAPPANHPAMPISSMAAMTASMTPGRRITVPR